MALLLSDTPLLHRLFGGGCCRCSRGVGGPDGCTRRCSEETGKVEGSSGHSQHRRLTDMDDSRDGIRHRSTKEGKDVRAYDIERERSPYPHYHGVVPPRPEGHLHSPAYDDTVSCISSNSSEGSSSSTLAARTLGRRMLYGRDRWRHDLPSWFYSDIERQQASIGTPPRHRPIWAGDHCRGTDLRRYSKMYDDPSFYSSRPEAPSAQLDLRPYRSDMVDHEPPQVSTSVPSSTLRRYSSAHRPSNSALDLSTTPSLGTLVGETGSLKASRPSWPSHC